jgi:protein tyrosine/serine phosphatase
VSRDGRVPEYDGLAYRHIHPEHREWGEVPYDERHSLARYLADRYLDLAETGGDGIAAAVKVIADEESAPVVVHCVAGKDRTGVVCALTLSLLGVDDLDIVEDYALSTAASKKFSAWLRGQLPESAPLPPPFLASPAEAMMLFLGGLRKRHGSVDGYLLDAGVTPDEIATLRTHLLD